MKEIQKIPLERRLKKVGNNVSNFLSAFELFTEDYFEGMAQISGNSYFSKVYKNEICKCNHSEGMVNFVSEMPHVVRSLKEEEASKLMYLILIEPFAMIEETKKEKKPHESVFYNA